MDFSYAVKQLNHEIVHLEAQIAEKRSARDKLASLLSPQEKLLIDQAVAEDKEKVAKGGFRAH